MTSRRWNQFIDFVNTGRPITDLKPPIQDKEEERIFNNMVLQLAGMRETDPDARFANVDIEWGITGDGGLYD